MRKKFVAIVACIAMMLTCFPAAGFAANSVKYLTWDQDQEKLIEAEYDGDYDVIFSDNATSTWGTDDGQDHWYVVKGKVKIPDTVRVKGHVHLILENGSELIAEKGVQIDNSNSENVRNSLSIYSQDISDSMGKLTASGNNGKSGITVNSKCELNICGGIITAIGSSSKNNNGGAGIGIASKESNGGHVNIYDGVINADGAATDSTSSDSHGNSFYGSGAGINGDQIVIWGGKIKATSPNSGAGIGGNYRVDGGVIIINGGIIEASAGSGAGIGGGCGGGSGEITINGGNIVAKSTNGAGIGSGSALLVKRVIGTGNIHEIIKTERDHDVNKNIIINGGQIEAVSTGAMGIGGGNEQYGGPITINGGNIESTNIGSKLTKEESNNGTDVKILNGFVITTDTTMGIGGNKITLQGGVINTQKGPIGGTSGTEFSTGENGNAVIFVGNKGIRHANDNEAEWNAIIFKEGSDGIYTGTIYGDEITPTEDFSVPENATLTVQNSETLILDGITMTIDGDSDDEDDRAGTVTNFGTIKKINGGKIVNNGVLKSDGGTIDGDDEEVDQPVSVEKVSLNKTAITLTVGQWETLKETVTPDNATNKDVTWKSDKEEVATVENGKVTAVAPGEATITVTTKDGNKKATCKVTVTVATVPVTGVTLDKQEATLEVGKSLDLKETVQPESATNKNVTWTSSDEKIAKVDNGQVTAVSAGTAEITVITVDGNKTATCNVTVTAAPVNVTGVTLDKQTATLKSGGSLTLQATVAPTNAINKNVSWSSSDIKVATVDSNGVVKAVAPGKATITVTTQDGSKTAQCVVTVESTNVAVTGVSLDKTSASLEVKDTLSLKATIAPANANNQNVTWSSSNEKVATVKDGVVTAVAPGEATITVKTVDGEKTATCKITVKAQTSQPTNPTDPSNPEEPSYQPDITDSDNGTVTVSPSNPQEGDKVTITPKPDQGYEVDDVIVTDKDGHEIEVTENADGSFTFEQPEGEVTITVTFKESKDEPTDPADPSELPFGDVKTSDWFYDPVKYVYDKGLMTGTSATEFAPNLTTTRGMIVSILHRLEGGPVVENDAFSDVSSDDWYGQSVAWAASVGVVNGFEDGTFRPKDPITREQMAAILYNYSQYKGYDVSARADLSKYSDAASVSSWAAEVLSWANAEGLVNGMTKTTLDPQASATRAQVATILMRYTQMIGE